MLKQSHYNVGCDAHKHYSLFAALDEHGNTLDQTRVNHEPGAIKTLLSQFPKGTPVALESVGNWYWIVDEIEAAGCTPLMAHALFAKKMMGHIHKTDKLDAEGLATLQHLGSLPTVWIAPGEIRDARELPRTRMSFSKVRTALKNRMHSTLAKHALSMGHASDIYAPKWRPQLLELIKTLPGVGKILSIVIDLEVGSIDRFPSACQLASYSGTVPKVKGSGGKYRHGRMIKQANNYLKWAFIEGANVVVIKRHHPNWRRMHVSFLYERIRYRKGHAVAVDAVARHLAEATFWILKKTEPYRDPMKVSPEQGQARA